MARKPQKILTAKCYVNGEPVCEINLETKEIKRFMPQEEWEEKKQKMLDNVSVQMSRYLQNHPDATLWNS